MSLVRVNSIRGTSELTSPPKLLFSSQHIFLKFAETQTLRFMNFVTLHAFGGYVFSVTVRGDPQGKNTRQYFGGGTKDVLLTSFFFC